MKKSVLYVLLVLFLGSMVFAETTIASSAKALELWAKTLVPSFLFPLILVRLLSAYHLLHPLLKRCEKGFWLLFRTDAYTMECILTSLFLGFPSSSLYLEQCAKEGNLTVKQKNRLLYCIFLASPNFILLSLGSVYESNITHALLYAQLCSIALLLLFTRKTEITMHINKKPVAFYQQLSASIEGTFQILLMILAYVLIIYVMIDLSCLFLTPHMKIPLKLLSEFSSGCFFIVSLPLNIWQKGILTSFLLSYGGLCVHMQVLSSIKKCDFSYIVFMVYRIIQIFLSCLLTYAFLL